MTTNEKTTAVAGLVTAIFGKKAIMTLGDTTRDPSEEPVPVISTGSLGLDLATRIGGYPKGRVVELFGAESSGKTTLALHAIAQAQRVGGVVAFIDSDHAFDVTYARAVGVDVGKLLVSQPDTGEQAFDIAEVLTRSGAVDLVVLDSLPNLTPRSETEGETSPDDTGLRARLASQALRKLTAVAHRTGTTVLFVNTLRKSSSTVWGTATTCNALKFYASMRVEVRRILHEETNGTAVPRTRVKVVKNKCAAPFTEAEFSILYGVGIDTLGELLDLGTACGVVERTGGVYTFSGSSLGRGRDRAKETLREVPELATTLRHAIVAASSTDAGPA